MLQWYSFFLHTLLFLCTFCDLVLNFLFIFSESASKLIQSISCDVILLLYGVSLLVLLVLNFLNTFCTIYKLANITMVFWCVVLLFSSYKIKIIFFKNLHCLYRESWPNTVALPNAMVKENAAGLLVLVVHTCSSLFLLPLNSPNGLQTQYVSVLWAMHLHWIEYIGCRHHAHCSKRKSQHNIFLYF